jgi:hypothetical protein
VAKLETLVDAFTATTINTGLWNSVTGGAATLDTVNDLVTLAVPTTSGATNTFGTSLTFDATSSAIYAQISVPPNGNGGTKVSFKLSVDANNSVAIRVESGVFKTTLQTAGSTATTTLPAYDPHQHRWWRLRETGGTWAADAAADGLNWTTLWTSSYSWSASATAMSFIFQTGASVTEASGSVAAISNVNTRLGGQSNPNWPLMEDAWAPYWNANAGSQPLDRYVEVTDRTRQTVSVSRGRQYELDQVRSGEAGLTLANTDGALDPTNTSGPWYGNIQPYQPYRRRAQWPPTRNLLDQVMASGGDLGGFAPGTISVSATDIFSSTDATNGSFVSSATAWQGTTVMQFAVPSATTATTRICHTPRVSAAPGSTYTVSLRVRNVTASTSLSVQAFAGWYTAGAGSLTSASYGSTSVLTGSTTAGWTTVTVTATAPANAAGVDVGVVVAATAAATCTVQVDGWQLEKGATASTWQAPGVWFPVYAGWTERWPSQWTMAGTYGTVQPTAVDTFSLLSQQQLSDPLTQEINSNAPRFVYKLDDPSGATGASDWTGQYPAAQLGISKYGAGTLTFGNTVTATDATGTYTGSSGTVVTINNATPGTNSLSAATFIKLGSAGILGPATMPWTRMIAFRYTGPTPTTSSVIWSCFDAQRSGGSPSGSNILLSISSSGILQWSSAGPTAAAGLRSSSTNVVDGDWHLVAFGMDIANSLTFIAVDGVRNLFTPSAATVPSGLISDNIGAYVDPTVANGTIQTFKGDVSFVAEFPSFLSATAITNLYTAWKASCTGESSNARYSRILRYAGYNGPSTIQTGLTTSMGPAAFDGQDAMSALQAVVDTENGAHYVDRAGTITFKARSARYNATTPAYTFGENTAAGEWPYEDCQLDFDSTHLSNQVTVTQEPTSQNFYASDATSLANYFPRSLARTINVTSANEAQDAAGYLLSRYKMPAQRVSAVKLHPSAIPALWPVCLSLELGTRVRVMRRPPGLPAVQVDCFVENIQWDFGDDGDAWCTLQCSPADLTPYGIFAAWHTTLHTTVASGVTTITVDASQDNVNPLAAQMAPGQQIVLGQNTTNQETVTVASVGATSPGWTTAVITLTAATTKAHTAGDVVNEVLPAGTTDPTTWDAVSKFDSIAFAY